MLLMLICCGSIISTGIGKSTMLETYGTELSPYYPEWTNFGKWDYYFCLIKFYHNPKLPFNNVLKST